MEEMELAGLAEDFLESELKTRDKKMCELFFALIVIFRVKFRKLRGNANNKRGFSSSHLTHSFAQG